jgi:hypothetical protein
VKKALQEPAQQDTKDYMKIHSKHCPKAPPFKTLTQNLETYDTFNMYQIVPKSNNSME